MKSDYSIMDDPKNSAYTYGGVSGINYPVYGDVVPATKVAVD